MSFEPENVGRCEILSTFLKDLDHYMDIDNYP